MKRGQGPLWQDWQANRGDLRIQVALLLFRAAHQLREPLDQRPSFLATLFGCLYRPVVQWLIGLDIPWKTVVGPRLRIYHGYGIVVNDRTTIGADVLLRHGVTIGHLYPGGGSPVIEDRVEFGVGSVVLGPVVVGEGARVAPNSVVVCDVPAGSTYKGFPPTWRGQSQDY